MAWPKDYEQMGCASERTRLPGSAPFGGDDSGQHRGITVEASTIVVAAAPLTFGTTLNRENVTEIPWASGKMPEGAFATKLMPRCARPQRARAPNAKPPEVSAPPPGSRCRDRGHCFRKLRSIGWALAASSDLCSEVC